MTGRHTETPTVKKRDSYKGRSPIIPVAVPGRDSRRVESVSAVKYPTETRVCPFLLDRVLSSPDPTRPETPLTSPILLPVPNNTTNNNINF